MSNPKPPLFIWDATKAARNVAKHKVTFEEAIEVFTDRWGRLLHDAEHSADEDRWMLLGSSFRNRVLVVVFIEAAATIRIISARRATKRERHDYEETIDE